MYTGEQVTLLLTIALRLVADMVIVPVILNSTLVPIVFGVEC